MPDELDANIRHPYGLTRRLYDAQDYVGFVRAVLTPVLRRASDHTRDDIIGAGLLGCAQALSRLDGQFNADQSYAYVKRTVEYAVMDHFRQQDTLSRKARADGKTAPQFVGLVPLKAQAAPELNIIDVLLAHEILATFPARTRVLLIRRHMLGETQGEVGVALGVCAARISQMETAALDS